MAARGDTGLSDASDKPLFARRGGRLWQNPRDFPHRGRVFLRAGVLVYPTGRINNYCRAPREMPRGDRPREGVWTHVHI
jgi:hypothetical protein